MVSNFSVSFPYHKVKVRVSLNADLGEDILEREDLVWRRTVCPGSHSIALGARHPETNPGCGLFSSFDLEQVRQWGFLCFSVSVTNMGILCVYIPGSCLD